jgi:DNA-directed RNA polymerase specialized sigma24 family protein
MIGMKEGGASPLENRVLRARARGETSTDAAFAALFQEYRPIVGSWLAVRLDSGSLDDLAQDVWLIFYGRFRRWEFGTEMESAEARPVLSFLFRTCQFVVRGHRRLARSRRSEPVEEAGEKLAAGGPDTLLRGLEAGKALSLARRICSEEEIDVFLATLAGMPAREVARTLSITEAVVDQRYRDALSRPLEDQGRDRLELEWRSLLAATSAPKRSPTDFAPGRRIAVSRVALLAQLEEVREEWTSIKHLVDAETGARFANAGWTLKDLLAHLASWAREYGREIATVARKESFDYAIPFAMSTLGPNQWNELEVDARRDRSLEEIFREFDEETGRLQELVIEIEEPILYRPAPFPLAPSGNQKERLPLTPAFLVSGKCLHDRYHFAQIRKLLDRLRE